LEIVIEAYQVIDDHEDLVVVHYETEPDAEVE